MEPPCGPSGEGLPGGGRDVSRAVDLETLIHPISLDEFARRYFEREVLHVGKTAPDRFRGLFSKRDAETLLWQKERCIPDFVRYTRDGEEEYPPHNLAGTGYFRWSVDKYQQGWTLVLHTLSECWLPTARLARSLEGAFGSPVYVVAFLTPAGSRGFLSHFDTPNVLVVQLEGTKVWRLHEAVVEAPLLRHCRPLHDGEVGEPTRVVTLHPGDLLYVPGGVVHSAEAQEEASLHLTIGFHPRRRVDLVKDLLEHAAGHHVELRRSAPPGAYADGRHPGPDELEALLPVLGMQLADAEAVRGGWERLDQRFVSSLRPLPDSYLRTGEMLAGLNLEDRVERRPGSYCHVERVEGGTVRLRFPGVGGEDERRVSGYLEGPAHVAEAFAFVAASRGDFAVSALPGHLTGDAKLTLARRLIREGLLRVAGPAA